VLIVDDEAEIVEVFARILEKRGFGVAVAADGGEALARLDATPFDVVVTDLRMPGLDGRELLRRLAARPPADRPALLVVTGDPLAAAREAFPIDPPPEVLEKPVEPGALAASVAALLARRAAAQ
jgi:CheY-like chemotaxis protein